MYDIILIITLAFPIVATRFLARHLFGNECLDQENEARRVAIYRFERLAGVIVFFQAALPPVIMTLMSRRAWLMRKGAELDEVILTVLCIALYVGYIAVNTLFISKQTRIAKAGRSALSSKKSSKRFGYLSILHCFTASLFMQGITISTGFIFPFIFALPYIILSLCMPLVYRRVLKAIPVDSILENAEKVSGALDIAARMGIRLPKIHVFPTDGEPLANAFICGMIPQFRHIYLSDLLLSQLSKEEVEAVIAHELGHAKNGDIWIKILMIPVVWAASLALGKLVLPEPWTTTVPVLLILSIIPLMGYLNRWTEERADRFAVKATAKPDAFISAFTKITELNQQPKKWSRADILMTHPDLEKRIVNIESTAIKA